MIKTVLAPVHREGWIFITLGLALTIILCFVHSLLACGGLLITLWMAYFFRNPCRITPIREGLIVSPADGIVQSITEAAPPAELGIYEGMWTRISIFLNVFDVHIQRIPITGVITKAVYHPGKFFNASLDKASEHNERQSLLITTTKGLKIPVVQIAGLIARRIRCDVKEEQSVLAGESYGLIRFGSRVDIYLPGGLAPLVIEGQRMTGGETIIADILNKEPRRQGECR